MSKDNKGLNFGVQFNINDSGNSLDGLSERIKKVNTNSKSLATNLSKIEKSYKGLVEATKAYNDAVDRSNNGGLSSLEKAKLANDKAIAKINADKKKQIEVEKANSKASVETAKLAAKQKIDIEKAKIKAETDLQKNADKLAEQRHQASLKVRRANKDKLAKDIANIDKEQTAREKAEEKKRIDYTNSLQKIKYQNFKTTQDKINALTSAYNKKTLSEEKFYEDARKRLINSRENIESESLKESQKKIESLLKAHNNKKLELEKAMLKRKASQLKVYEKEELAYQDKIENQKIKNAKESAAVFQELFRQQAADMKRYKKEELDYNNKVEDAKIKSARESAAVFQNELKNQLQDYKDAQSQMTSGASYLNGMTNKDTTFGNSSSLKYSILSAGISLVGIRALAAAFSDLGRNIVDVNYNAINTQRIMDDFSQKTTESLIETAISIAKGTGTQVTDVQKIQSAWVRINDAYSDSEELLGRITDLTAKFMHVGEIEDAEEAVKLLNATLLQFNDTGRDSAELAEEVLNKWAYMADKTALGTADEFGASMAKIGGYMKSLGGGIDDAIVMTSILGDRLTKTGDEAGNSLKTINAYLTRQKTINLFDSLGSDANGLSYSLKNANGEFLEFTDLMNQASRAYNDFKNAGEDDTAVKIREALGATRQGDVALSLLQNWATDSAKYYAMVEESITGEMSYLDKQNAALMESFKSQWNSLYATILGFGMAVANSGLLDGLTDMMGITDGIFQAITDLNPEILDFATTLGSVALGLFAFKSIGEMTGLLTAFTTAVKLGTQGQREAAMVTTTSADAYFKSAIKLANGNTAEIATLAKKRLQYNELARLYKQGAINADQYSNALKKLITVENIEAQTLQRTAAAQEVNNILRSQGVIVQGTLNLATILSTQGALAQTTALIAQAAAQKVLNGVMQVGTMLKGLLLNPFTLVTLGITAVVKIFDTLNVSAEEQQEKINDLKAAYEKLNSELDVLIKKETAGTLTDSETERLEYLRERVGLEEDLTKAMEKQAALADLNNISMSGLFETAKQMIAAMNDADKYAAIVSKGTGLENEVDSVIKNAKYEKSQVDLLAQSYKNATNARKALTNKRDNFAPNSQEWKKYNDLINDAIKKEDEAQVKLNNKKVTYSQLSESLGGYSEKIRQYTELDIWTDEEKAKWAGKAQQIDALKVGVDALIESTKPLADIEVGINADEWTEATKNLSASISSIDSDIETLSSGEATVNDIIKMMETYQGNDFYKVANAGAAEQVQFLKDIRAEQAKAFENDANAKQDELLLKRREVLERIVELERNSKGEIVDQAAFDMAIDKIKRIDSDWDKIEETKTLTLFVESTALEDAVDIMGDLVSSTQDLVDAQNQLATGTALSAEQLFGLSQKYPELLQQSNFFNESSVSGQQQAISAVLDMKDQEFDAKLDIQIAELQTEYDLAQKQLDVESEKAQVLLDIENASANTTEEGKKALQDAIVAYNELEKQNFVTLKNGEVEYDLDTKNEQLSNTDDANQKQSTLWGKLYDSIGSVFKGVSELSRMSASDIVAHMFNGFGKIAQGAVSAFEYIKAKLSGQDVADMDVGSSSIDDAGNMSKTTGYLSYTGEGGKAQVNGADIAKWIGEQKTVNDQFKDIIMKEQGHILSSIDNLKYLKDLTIPEIINKFSPTDDKSSDVSKAETEAAKAAEDAAKAAEKAATEAEKAAEAAAEAAERLIETYTKEVESLQDRIVKALKAKYQEEYETRKKYLEKEQETQLKFHNDRISQLQDEIDKINGNTKEDKTAKLTTLQSELDMWMKDDSTLGKSKQKELTDRIEELSKEISIDDLESQIETEQDKVKSINDKFAQLFDSDSPLYDPVLKDLDTKMTNKALYDQANDMIRNNKTQEIIDLLTAFDPDYSGIAQLMGLTAGQIIAAEVVKAINAYNALINGVSSSPVSTPSSPSPSTPSEPSTPSGGGSDSGGSDGQRYHEVVGGDPWGDTLWDLAEKYYGDGSQWEKIYNANTDQIDDPSTIYPGQRLLIPFKIGGYTGDQEGAAYLHKKERVLTAQQTAAFDNLVYNAIPKLDSKLINTSVGDTDNSKSINYNGELVKINVGQITNQTPFDIKNTEDNLNRLIISTLQKSGTNIN